MARPQYPPQFQQGSTRRWNEVQDSAADDAVEGAVCCIDLVRCADLEVKDFPPDAVFLRELTCLGNHLRGYVDSPDPIPRLGQRNAPQASAASDVEKECAGGARKIVQEVGDISAPELGILRRWEPEGSPARRPSIPEFGVACFPMGLIHCAPRPPFCLLR